MGGGGRIRHVYFFHHTHTDIGYTHPQEEVAEQQAQNIVTALEYCRRTEDRSPESRFAWTIETGWTLRQFWERADDSERELLARYCQEGRVQITGSYFHLTQLVPPELLLRSLLPTLDIARQCGVEVDTAMSSDINGVNWAAAHIYPQVGIRYLIAAVNPTRGGSPLPRERPGGFWWKSPAGDRVFVWNNEHYMYGVELLDFPVAPSFDALSAYMRSLEERGYPYDTIMLPLQGYHIDNAMPNLAVCDMVEEFNQRAGGPLCRLVTVGEALRDMAKRYGDAVPVRRAAWPDWWDDGVASSAFETGLVRYAHEDMTTAEKAASVACAMGATWPFRHGEMERLRDNLLLYDEHTWGWWRSVEDQFSLETRTLGHRKTSFAEDAAFEGRRYRDRALRTLAERVVHRHEARQLIAFNPLAHARREVVRYPVGWRLSGDSQPTALRVVDGSGHEVPSQCHIVRYTGHLIPFTDFWIDFLAEVPALGYAVYRLEDTGEPVSEPQRETAGTIENEFYRIEVDEQGRVLHLIDKDLNRDLAGEGPWHLNQLIYEQVVSPGGRADLLIENFPPFEFAPERAQVERWSPERATVHVMRDPFGVSLVSETAMHHFPRIVQEIRLHNGSRHVEFVTRFVKEEVEATEAVHIAFPLAIHPERVRCDISGGAFEPGTEQLPGTATDWYNLRHGVLLQGDGIALTWLCGEAPLVEFGEMKTGKTPSPPILDNGVLFSYALNNHWFTNFFARQSGDLTFRYRLLSGRDGDLAGMAREGREVLTPLAVLSVEEGSARGPGVKLMESDGAPAGSTASLIEVVDGTGEPDAVCPARDGDGWIVRVYDTGGQEGTTRLRLRWPTSVRVTRCDILERAQEDLPVENGEVEVALRPYGTATLRLRSRIG
ncbi:MAG TPA: glycoside hydrolase family 38 C-terminal domain-containing protein [Chloroflexota bacterium]